MRRRTRAQSWRSANSITDGDGSTVDGNDRWPDRLAERFVAAGGAGGSAVAFAAFIVGPDHDDAVAVDEGERRKKDGIEKAEDGGGGADAQSQGE